MIPTAQAIFSIGFEECKRILELAPENAETWIHVHYSSEVTTDAFYAVVDGRVYGVSIEEVGELQHIDRNFGDILEMISTWVLTGKQYCHVINLKELAAVIAELEMKGNVELEQFIFNSFEMSLDQAKDLYGEQFITQCDEFLIQQKHQMAKLQQQINQGKPSFNHGFDGDHLARYQVEAIKLNALG